jgi:hypothetical protein
MRSLPLRGPRRVAAIVAASVATLLAAAGLPPAQAADPAPMAGPASCRFRVPEGWPLRPVRWSGSCHAGLAEGGGTLRLYRDGRVARVFYGLLEQGQPTLGVIEQPGGFVAGHFEAGKVVADGERNTLIQAFDTASEAARQLAETYRLAGNAASARFYQDKARQLAQQMD